MEKADKENKSIGGGDSYKGSSGKKLKINPNIKITPTPKTNGKEENKPEDNSNYILEKLKDFEKEEEQRKAAKTLEEQKKKIAEEVRQMASLADDIYTGKAENTQDPAAKVKAMYELFKTITKSNFDELNSMLQSNLDCEMYERLMDIVLGDENREENTIHKLKILIRDLQDKTPKIHDEVNKFVEGQKKWRQEKEEEFQKSIATIKSQMSPANTETGENEMMSKYKDLCEYVETMRKEVDGFKEAREKLIQDREEKIRELEETKNTKLVESKRNIEEKIHALKTESDRLKKDLPSSRKDYTTHKKESKKLVSIIEANNKKKKEFKDTITKLNNELRNRKNNQKESQSLVDALKESLEEKKQTQEKLQKELEQIASECKEIQEKVNAKKQ